LVVSYLHTYTFIWFNVSQLVILDCVSADVDVIVN